MIGLDTNILVRYIVRDNDAQAAAATKLIESMCTTEAPGFVNTIVLCELCWVLLRGYRYKKDAVMQALRGLLTATELQVEESETAWRALRAFERGKADFSDYLIGSVNQANKAQTTYTFDSKAANHTDFTLLKP